MNAFRIALPHRQAMPKLLERCDEAAALFAVGLFVREALVPFAP